MLCFHIALFNLGSCFVKLFCFGNCEKGMCFDLIQLKVATSDLVGLAMHLVAVTAKELLLFKLLSTGC